VPTPPPLPARTRCQALLLAALLCALATAPLASAPVEAATYDPALRWETLQTEHFNVTFHEELRPLAQAMGRQCDEVYHALEERWGHASARRVELLLVDWTDDANGYATPLPVNTIVIFVTAPQEASTLNLYADWNRAILTHELTHILHLDTVEGVPRALRLVFGRIVSVNLVTPGWITEGLATWTETELTPGGRGRASQADMIKRMTTLEGHFPPLGNLEGFQADPPSGNLRYLFGQDFIQYIAEQKGHEVWREWIHTYGRWWVPFWLPSRRVFGESFRSMYKDWRASVQARYAAVEAGVVADGLTVGTLLSDGEAACAGPRFSPDGQRMVWSCYDRGRGPAIYLAGPRGEDPERIYRLAAPRNFAWRPDSRAFIFASSHAYDVWYSFDDLYQYDLESEKVEMLTERARARDPEFSPDGGTLLSVVNAAQNNDLAALRVGGWLEHLTEHHDQTQLSTPRYAPDGQRLALSVWRDGQRDLWLYQPDGTPIARLTDDAAIDREPCWTPDGATLLFVSDRTGISNVYALDLADAHLWQVTNVLGGAFQPDVSPDGTLLAYTEFTWNGEDVRLLPLDRGQWRDRGVLETAARALGNQLEHKAPPRLTGSNQGTWAEVGPAPDPDPPHEPPPVLPSHPYRPLPSLLPPRYMIPEALLTGSGVMAVLGTGGADTLRRWQYNAYLTYRTDDRFLGGGGALTWNRWRTLLSAGGSLATVQYGSIYLDPGTPPDGGATIPGVERSEITYWDKRTTGWAQVTYPLGRRQYLFARFTGQQRESQYALPAGTYLGALPTQGVLSSLGGGWRFHRAEAYAYSISPERSRTVSVVGEWTTHLLGSEVLDDSGESVPFDQVQLSAEWREYPSLPWHANHVLAWRAATGLSLGDTLNYGSFRLGGTYGDGSLYVLPEEYRSLRGFPAGAVYGDLYYLASLEYRLPIWRIDRGLGTWPFFLRTVHGAVFCDAGNALTALPQSGAEAGTVFGDTLVGVGAELRLDMVLGWGLGLTSRLGYGFGLNGPYAIPFGSTDGFYAQVGSSF
jgi:hypothetical protein